MEETIKLMTRQPRVVCVQSGDDMATAKCIKNRTLVLYKQSVKWPPFPAIYRDSQAASGLGFWALSRTWHITRNKASTKHAIKNNRK